MKKSLRLPPHVTLGPGAEAEPNTQLGVPPQRLNELPRLVIGRNAVIRSGSIIYAGSTIGDGLETGHNTIIREQNTIGQHFRLWNNSTIDYGCKIGNEVKIHCNCYVAQYTVLEDDVFLAPGATIANDLYPGMSESADIMKGPHLEQGVQVGVNATILPYVTIGAKSLIGAGAVVTKDLSAGVVAVGNPARVIGNISELKNDWLKRLTEVPH